MARQQRRRIGEEWTKYREAVIPADAPSVQLLETRRPFYAGALAYHAVVFRDISSPENQEATADDIQMMADLHAELEDFGKRAARGLV